MAVETAEDRAVFVNPSDFGVAATYTPSGGSPASVNGIFDAGYFAVGVEAGVPLAAAQLRFVARTADLPNVANGATLLIGSTTYIIRNVEHDGTGMTTLVLEQ